MAGASTLETCEACGKQVFTQEMVTIPAAEYQRLVMGAGQTAHLLRDMRLRPRGGPPNKLLADEEVAAFLVDHLGKMTKADLVEAARQRFGEERGPSAGQVERFALAVRAQLEEPSGLKL